MITKGKLAILLSKLKGFQESKTSEEQYLTDSEIAATVLMNANILGDFADKCVADLGAGTGLLGIGALLLGAKQAVFVEKDAPALAIARENYENTQKEWQVGKATFYEQDICEFSPNPDLKIDVVIMNPPFGTKTEHADKKFLETAFKTAPIVYSFHKTTTRKFVEAIAKDSRYKITHYWDFEFPLKQTMKFHSQRIKRIAVTAYRFQQI